MYDLIAHDARRDVPAGEVDQVLKSQHRLLGAGGVDDGQRSSVAAGEGLEIVKRLRPPQLSEHDPVRAHPQAVDEQLPQRDLALALYVGPPRLHPHHVALPQPQLYVVLDGDDALPLVDVGGEHLQERGLARPGGPGDQHIDARLHAGPQEAGHGHVEGAPLHQLLKARHGAPRLAQGDEGAADGDGRVDDVHPGAVAEVEIGAGAGLVHPLPGVPGHALHHRLQVGLVIEPALALLKHPVPLDVDGAWAVHHDLGDAPVLKHGRDGAVAEQIIDQLVEQGLSGGAVQPDPSDPLEVGLQISPQLRPVGSLQPRGPASVLKQPISDGSLQLGSVHRHLTA